MKQALTMQSFGILAVLVGSLVLGIRNTSVAQSVALPEMFFDADRHQIAKDSGEQTFDGHVVAMGGGIILSADHVRVHPQRSVLSASGSVILITPSEVLTADSLDFDSKSGDFRARQASLTLGDRSGAEAATQNIFAFSLDEIAFEAERAQRLLDNRQQRDAVIADYRRALATEPEPSKQRIEHMALLIEREDAIRKQVNPHLQRLGPNTSERATARRAYWERMRQQHILSGKSLEREAFLRLAGSRIARSAGNDIHLEDSSMSPCRCAPGDNPDWGFRAQHIDAQVEGYANMYHPVLEIRGVPVLYLPYLRVPVKQQRQSGFLFPTLQYNKRSGNIFRQPVFLDFDPSLDGTLTLDFFQRRGTRLGWEMRRKTTRQTGWQWSIEAMRDSLWEQDRNMRSDTLNLYERGMLAARQEGATRPRENLDYPIEPIEPGLEQTRATLMKYQYWTRIGYEECVAPGLSDEARQVCISRLQNALAVPRNDWRGSLQWKGHHYLAPRLSVVTAGGMPTDHRYHEDLYIASGQDVAGPSQRKAPPAFSPARGRVHLDAEHFYLGAGSSLGDNVQTSEPFVGQQIPGYASFTSRWVELPGIPIPIYVNALGDLIEIRDLESKILNDPFQASRLGHGQWQRAKLRYATPVAHRGIVRVDHFGEGEVRQIRHDNLEPHRSQIHSYLAGLRFSLPLDGIGRIPDILQDRASAGTSPQTATTDGAVGDKYLQHVMNWDVTLSVRPTVGHEGPYGQREFGPEEVYFASDAHQALRDDDGADDVMQPHQKVVFETQHSWRTFRRAWTLLPGKSVATDEPTVASSESKAAVNAYFERARRELLYSRDQPVEGSNRMLRNDDWLVPRYQRSDIVLDTPATLKSSVSHDWMRIPERKAAGERGDVPFEKLPEPWSPIDTTVEIRALESELKTRLVYNTYTDTTTDLDFTLRLPSVFSSRIILGLNIDQATTQNVTTGAREHSRSFVRSLALMTSLIPRVTLHGEWKEKDPGEEYATRFGIDFFARSECWGLRVLREKDFLRTEENAHYLLELFVIFMGQQRTFQDMSRPIVREVVGEAESQAY